MGRKYIFEKWWIVPRDKVNIQMEFLTETFSKPNERGCEVTLRSKLSPSGLKEMNGYLSTWNKETGNSRPPSWLSNFSSESVNKFTFSLKYDLIKKDWFGQYGSPVPNTNTTLGNYRTALKGELIVVIQREKDRITREQERIDRIEKEKAYIEKQTTENVAREKQLDIQKQNKLESVKKQLEEDQKQMASYFADGGEVNFCQQVAPEIPRSALRNGTSGNVKVKFSVKEGGVVDITILSGPKVYHEVVKSALMRYQCRKYIFPVEIEQAFNFRIE